ncbi:hypothetical protein E4T56_gene11353 [Termitomyces sp. T112]|nr:hypothetical protein E4T56_gene11353 [Termitomyces sp. T112]
MSSPPQPHFSTQWYLLQTTFQHTSPPTPPPSSVTTHPLDPCTSSSNLLFLKTPNAPLNFRPCPAPILISPNALLANSNTSPANSDGPLANFDAFSAATDTYSGSPKPREPPPLFPIFATHHQLNTLAPSTHSGVSQQPWGDPHSQMIPSTYQCGPTLDRNQHLPTPSSFAKPRCHSQRTPKFSVVKLQLLVTKLHSSAPIILGFSWLHSTNPHIDWPSLTLHLDWDNPTDSGLVPFDVSPPSKSSESMTNQLWTPSQLYSKSTQSFIINVQLDSLPEVLPALVNSSASSTFISSQLDLQCNDLDKPLELQLFNGSPATIGITQYHNNALALNNDLWFQAQLLVT